MAAAVADAVPAIAHSTQDAAVNEPGKDTENVVAEGADQPLASETVAKAILGNKTLPIGSQAVKIEVANVPSKTLELKTEGDDDAVLERWSQRPVALDGAVEGVDDFGFEEPPPVDFERKARSRKLAVRIGAGLAGLMALAGVIKVGEVALRDKPAETTQAPINKTPSVTAENQPTATAAAKSVDVPAAEPIAAATQATQAMTAQGGETAPKQEPPKQEAAPKHEPAVAHAPAHPKTEPASKPVAKAAPAAKPPAPAPKTALAPAPKTAPAPAPKTAPAKAPANTGKKPSLDRSNPFD
jgi:hypothetical protein